MGTRHLICVLLDGEMKVAQYGQWDGYPSHTGAEIIKFIKENDMAKFTDAVRNCVSVDDNEIDRLCEGKKKIPTQFSRDTGSDILKFILQENGAPLCINEAFAGDGLMCEWAYVVDLDTNSLEVYTGFKKELQENRFSKFDDPASEYKPVHLVETYSFNDLPKPDMLEDRINKKLTA